MRKVDSLPAVYRQCMVRYTDFWQTYADPDIVLFAKEAGKTSLIERLTRCDNVFLD